jgi:hypothetical protein
MTQHQDWFRGNLTVALYGRCEQSHYPCRVVMVKTIDVAF